MASLEQLLNSPALSSTVVYLARPQLDPTVDRVALIEDVSELNRVEGRAIVLLTRGASASASSYRFDVALRLARDRDVAALVLSGADFQRITPTSAEIAERASIAILGTGGDVDLAGLALAIGRELSGAADAALMRTHAAARAVGAHPVDGKLSALVERAGAALGVPLSMVDAQPVTGPRAPVIVDGHAERWLTASPQEGDLGLGLDIVLQVTAAGARDALANAQRAEEIPILSRAEVLTELLSAPQQDRPQLVWRARSLEIPIDGWHVAVRLEFEELADVSSEETLAAYEARVGGARAALQAVRAGGGIWHSARAGLAVLLLRMYREDPGVAATNEVVKTMERALARLKPRLSGAVLRCGVGSAHAGPGGLLSSAAEAKAAVTAARTSGRVGTAVPFDSIGLRRTLVEWYASQTAREAVATVLAPLDELGGARAERLIQTLHVYLDQRGSLSRTAKTLNLHRNAVSYRMSKIFALLDVDPDSPDDLLLLQLACRARELT